MKCAYFTVWQLVQSEFLKELWSGSAGMTVLALLGTYRPAWRGEPGGRWRAAALGTMAFAGLVVGSVGGVAYLTDRVSTTEVDFQGRLAHWDQSLGLLTEPGDALWGKGIGRYPAQFALSGVTTDQTGDYRWLATPEG